MLLKRRYSIALHRAKNLRPSYRQKEGLVSKGLRQVAGIVATITEQKVPSAVFGAKTLLFLFHLGKVPKMLASLRAGINMSPDLQS